MATRARTSRRLIGMTARHRPSSSTPGRRHLPPARTPRWARAHRGVREAATLCASVTGQDIEATDDGTFVIMRRVAKDRIISVVDPEARHGHKTSAHAFDGYKGHIAIDVGDHRISRSMITRISVL